MSISILRFSGIVPFCAIVAMTFAACSNDSGSSETGGDKALMKTEAVPDPAAALEQKNTDLSREFIDKVFNQGDTAFAAAHIAANFVEHNPSPGQDPGVAGFMAWLKDLRTGFPDVKMNIEDIIAKGDVVVMRTTMTGTNTGPFMGSPATNKAVKMEVIDIVKLADGKMTDHWGQADVMAMMTQMGMMAPPGGAPAKK